MGTEWWMQAEGGASGALVEAEALVHAEEARYSRFRPASMLSVLNRDRAVCDRSLADLVTVALEMRAATDGAFDPGVGAAVVAAGYSRSFEELPAPGAAPDGEAAARGAPAAAGEAVAAGVALTPAIRVAGHRVMLSGGGLLDLGGIAKGWTVDRVGELLADRGCVRYVVDGGGDIAVGGVASRRPAEAIALGDSGLAVGISAGAVATSSTLKRRWLTPAGARHHIIAPCGGVPS